MNSLPLALLLVFVVGSFCFSDHLLHDGEHDDKSMLAKPPPHDCPNMNCPRGFECRKGLCTLMYPSKYARMSRKAMKCTERWECPTRMSCTNGFCT